MKRTVCLTIAVLFLAVALAGCSLTYSQTMYKRETGEKVTEFGLIGLPASRPIDEREACGGLLPLWRKVAPVEQAADE